MGKCGCGSRRSAGLYGALGVNPEGWHGTRMIRPAMLIPVLALLSACATTPAPSPPAGFWQALESHCGKAYAGRLVSNEAPDAAMRGAAMAMHVRECSPTRIAVPFHVQRADGTWDRSRTWLITRSGSDGQGGFRLKHDHRHEDGTSDELTMYGGVTATPGTARAQDFPVDAESIALFRRTGRDVSVTNIWRVEVDPAGAPDGRFAYQLTRTGANARLFRVEFDLAGPIAPPPAPWGW